MTRIALVEDNADNRLLIQVLLEDFYEVSSYESGQEALAGIPADRPALVLLDISLPGMDGREVLRRLREEHGLRDLPIIALTAHAMAGDREACLRAGFDEYVTKPVEEEALLSAMRKVLKEEA